MTGPSHEFRLPKPLASDPKAAAVDAALQADTAPLWPGGRLRVPVVRLGRPLKDALSSALRSRRVVRGLENAEKKLVMESRGLDRVDRKSGAARGQRISRLLLVSNDCAERMLRRVETLAQRHAGRVLVIQLDCSDQEIGSLLYGPGSTAKLLMLDHKEAVAAALLALVD